MNTVRIRKSLYKKKSKYTKMNERIYECLLIFSLCENKQCIPQEYSLYFVYDCLDGTDEDYTYCYKKKSENIQNKLLNLNN